MAAKAAEVSLPVDSQVPLCSSQENDRVPPGSENDPPIATHIRMRFVLARLALWLSGVDHRVHGSPLGAPRGRALGVHHRSRRRRRRSQSTSSGAGWLRFDQGGCSHRRKSVADLGLPRQEFGLVCAPSQESHPRTRGFGSGRHRSGDPSHRGRIERALSCTTCGNLGHTEAAALWRVRPRRTLNSARRAGCFPQTRRRVAHPTGSVASSMRRSRPRLS